MKPLTKRQVKILVLSIFGTVLLLVFVVILVYFRLKDDKRFTGNGNAGQQQGLKGKPGPGGTEGTERGPQDKKDNQGRPLKTAGSVQEAEVGVQNDGPESEPNTMKAKNSRSTDQKVTTVNNEASTAKPLISDQPGNATELGKNNSGTESSGKIGKEEKQLTTESVTTEALSTMNSQQVDDLIAKSKAVNASTPAETLTLNSNVALLSLTKKIKDEYASDANAQAWMNSGFQMQELDSIDHDKNFDTRFFPPSPPQG